MKRSILILTLLLCLYQAAAQTSDAYKNEINHIFEHVNRTPVTTGLLLDYGIEFTNIRKHNGALNDTNYVNIGEWRSVYNTLYASRFNSNATILHPEQVNDRIDSIGMLHIDQSGSPIHNIVALHINYQKFKDNALSGGSVSVNNDQIYAGNSPAPYEAKFAFAAALKHDMLKGAVHRFYFKASELLFSNTGKSISSVQADFGDGAGYRAISYNGALATATYSSEGEKDFKLKVNYTDGSMVQSHSKFYVTKIDDQQPLARYTGNNLLVQQFPLAGFDAPQTYLGGTAGALVTVEYAGTRVPTGSWTSR